VSVAIYFAILWPQVEPLDEEEEDAFLPATAKVAAEPAAEPAKLDG
jgi:hypothetical protein